jgi:transposase
MNEKVLVVGIDAGRFTHEWALVEEGGKVVWRKGVANVMVFLRSALKQVETRALGTVLVFAMEMDYGNSGALVRLLLEAGHEVRLCAPLRVKRYRESLGLGNKNDKKDAGVIARFCLERRERLPKAHRPRSGRQALRILSRQLDRVSRQRTRQGNYLRGLLVEYYPDLVSARLLGVLPSPTALAFLRRYSALSRAKGASVTQLTEVLRQASRGKIGKERAQQIKEHLKDYDLPAVVEQAYAEVVRSLVKTLELLLAEEERLLTLAERVAVGDHHYQKLLEVPGIASRLGVKILGEMGDPQAYGKEEKWAAHAGYVPVERQSGEGRGLRFLPQACNKRLREAIFQSCVASLKSSPASRAYYDRKVQEAPPKSQPSGKGRKYKPAVRALLALGRHRCRLIWKLLTTEERYDESKLGQNARREEAQSLARAA